MSVLLAPAAEEPMVSDVWRHSGSLLFPHEALLNVARRVYSAATAGDPRRLERAALRLLEAVELHVRGEDAVITRIPPHRARPLRCNEQRILALATALVRQAKAGCVQPHQDCRERAEELLARCFVQARDEQSALRELQGT